MKTEEITAIRQRLPAIPREQMSLAEKDRFDLLAYVEQLAARLDTQQKEQAEMRGKVTSFLEDLANGCVPVKMERGIDTTPYWRGVNTERAKLLAWAELKAKELGIDWPIKPIPYKGDLPAAADLPAPACLLDCSSCQSPYAMPENAANVRKEAHRIGYETSAGSCQSKKGGADA